VFLLRKEKAQALKLASAASPAPATTQDVGGEPVPGTTPVPIQPPLVTPATGSDDVQETPATPAAPARKLRLTGTLPPNSWNRAGTMLIPKLRNGQDLHIQVTISVELNANSFATTRAEIMQALMDMGLAGDIQVFEE
jgi:hypothetical protein